MRRVARPSAYREAPSASGPCHRLALAAHPWEQLSRVQPHLAGSFASSVLSAEALQQWRTAEEREIIILVRRRRARVTRRWQDFESRWRTHGRLTRSSARRHHWARTRWSSTWRHHRPCAGRSYHRARCSRRCSRRRSAHRAHAWRRPAWRLKETQGSPTRSAHGDGDGFGDAHTSRAAAFLGCCACVACADGRRWLSKKILGQLCCCWCIFSSWRSVAHSADFFTWCPS